MNKKITSTLFAILLALGFSTSAFSQGLNIGIQYHTMGFYGVGEEKPSNNAGNKDRKEAGAFTDEVFSVFAEYDTGPVSIGIGYIPETIASPENTNIQHTSNTNSTNLTNTAKVDINDIMTIYASVDIPLGRTYLKVGLREATVETKEGSLDEIPLRSSSSSSSSGRNNVKVSSLRGRRSRQRFNKVFIVGGVKVAEGLLLLWLFLKRSGRQVTSIPRIVLLFEDNLLLLDSLFLLFSSPTITRRLSLLSLCSLFV